MAEKRTTGSAGVGELLRVPVGPVDLAAYDPAATPGFTGSKAAGKSALVELGAQLADQQERLVAHGRTGGHRRVLLVLQGMDTSGKGGVVKHVVGQVDPQGVSVHSFKAPTAEELSHDFLWRIRKGLPAAGVLGVFDRSHYEDVGVVRVHGLVEPEVWSSRYTTINNFEQELVDDGCAVVKVFLHISREAQRERLLARLDDPTKHWKYNPGDVDERLLWDDYRVAYQEAIERCNTDAAPWYVVPADRKWYRNWAITQLLLDSLRSLALEWPAPTFDVATERARVEAS